MGTMTDLATIFAPHHYRNVRRPMRETMRQGTKGAVEEMRLRRPDRLPGDQDSPQKRVHRLGKGRAGLVRGDVKQTDCRLVSITWLHLPAHAAELEPDNLVAAENRGTSTPPVVSQK